MHITSLQRCKTVWKNTSENSALVVSLIQEIEFYRVGLVLSGSIRLELGGKLSQLVNNPAQKSDLDR